METVLEIAKLVVAVYALTCITFIMYWAIREIRKGRM